MPALAVKPKLASRQKTSFDAIRINAIAHLIADLHRESDAANDELASDQNVYSYVDNNPLSFTDPTGHSRLSRAVHRVTRSVQKAVHQVKEQVARSTTHVLQQVSGVNYVGGLLSTGLLAGTHFGWAYGASTGDWKSVGRAQVQGAAIAGTMWLGAEFGATGRMFGSGINGYLQTGNSEGFLRGFASGGIPQDLGFANAYNTSPWANIGIGIARDATRGYVVGGKEGIVPGIGYGQFNNAVGHLVGFTTSGFSAPKFSQGAFVYEGSWWSNKGALTLGNVISGPTNFSSRPDYAVHYAHERNHISNPVEQGLGALYAPAHVVDLAVGHTGRILGQGTDWFLLEEHVQQYPYSTLPPWPR